LRAIQRLSRTKYVSRTLPAAGGVSQGPMSPSGVPAHRLHHDCHYRVLIFHRGSNQNSQPFLHPTVALESHSEARSNTASPTRQAPPSIVPPRLCRLPVSVQQTCACGSSGEMNEGGVGAYSMVNSMSERGMADRGTKVQIGTASAYAC